MNVLFAIREDYSVKLGGDSIQMLKTKEYLEKQYKINIKIITNYNEIEKYSNYNIIHIFNLQTIDITNKFITEGKKRNKKIVLSPIYWNLWHALFVNCYFKITNSITGIKYFKWLKRIYRSLAKFIPYRDLYLSKNYVRKRREAIENSDLLLPNSHEELACISKDLDINYSELLKKSVVVPNAFDDSSILNIEDNPVNLKDYVLVVGRLEPYKNQLSVVLSLFDNPEIPIVLVGKPVNAKYKKKIEKIAKLRGNVFFIEEVEHSKIYSLYKNAAVHVLPSFRESPGLATLEALSVGCNVVVSSKEFCPIKYYNFDKIATICNPYDIKSIKQSILNAMAKPRVSLDLSFFTYSNVSKIIYNAYKKL